MEEKESYFSIYAKDSFIMIKNNKSLNITGFNLQININDLSLNVIRDKEDMGKKIQECLGIIGIIALQEETYLVVITKAILACSINKNDIYKVLDTNFIKLNEEMEEEDGDGEKSEDSIEGYYKDDENQTINQLKELFKNGFYFSNTYDLANSLTSQNQIKNYFAKQKKLLSDYDYIAEGNKNFLANFKLTSRLLPEKKKNKTFFLKLYLWQY